MAKQNMVAIGRLVMSTRERICAIEIEEGGLVLNTLRTAEEVRGLDEIGSPDLPKPDPQMLQIAEKIVEQQSGEFDPSEFRDRYEDALRALIEEKRKGKPVKPRPSRPTTTPRSSTSWPRSRRASKTAAWPARARRALRRFQDKAPQERRPHAGGLTWSSLDTNSRRPCAMSSLRATG